jgi:hypothetical protein
MRHIALALICVVAASVAGQVDKWDAKTTVEAAQVLTALRTMDLTSAQLEKLHETSLAIQKAKAKFAERQAAVYEREKSRVADLANWLLAGKEPTEQQTRRLEEIRKDLQQIVAERDSTISQLIANAAATLTRDQTEKVVYDDRVRGEARAFLNRIRSVPEAQWETFSRQAAFDLMRGQIDTLGPMFQMGQEGTRGGDRRGPRDDMRRRLEELNAQAEQQLMRFRTMPESQLEEAVTEVARLRVGDRAVQNRLNEFLRQILEPDGAPAAISAWREAKGRPK